MFNVLLSKRKGLIKYSEIMNFTFYLHHFNPDVRKWSSH